MLGDLFPGEEDDTVPTQIYTSYYRGTYFFLITFSLARPKNCAAELDLPPLPR